MQIRRAEQGEAAALSQIAWRAKAHWGYPASWLEGWRELLTITPEFVSANETFVAVVEGEIVAFHALLEHEGRFWLEHLWVLPEQMRRGIGRKLFTHAVERALARGASSLTIEADPNAETFYRHLGAVRVGTVASEVEGRRRELPLLIFDLTIRSSEGEKRYPASN
jgi:ribosomal protein S18 acetylase RimI-like enzyme